MEDEQERKLDYVEKQIKRRFNGEADLPDLMEDWHQPVWVDTAADYILYLSDKHEDHPDIGEREVVDLIDTLCFQERLLRFSDDMWMDDKIKPA